VGYNERRMAKDSALAKMRKICAALPGTTEGKHHDAIAFKAGTKLYATFRELGDDSLIVFGLHPDHLDALVASDPRFDRYPRAKGAVQVRSSQITDWRLIRDLLEESHGMVARPVTKKLARKPRR
jgi:predicted DNA-binding protein (MmcQ/YjbR family)